jgi:tetratricopeptide (TPR) repeat protein
LRFRRGEGDPDRQRWVAGIVSLITFVVYLPSLLNGFVNWDDSEYILDNPHLRTLNGGFLAWAFTGFYASNWHPITWLSHAFDLSLWGTAPPGHHLTNVLLHAVNTFLITLLATNLAAHWQSSATLRQRFAMAGSLRQIAAERPMPTEPIPSFVVGGVTGLLFGLHPLHVESVAWVSERKDLLCALFYLAGILAYVQRRTGRLYPVCLFSFLLALMSKPMAVSFPFILLILDWCPLGRIGSARDLRHALREKAAFFAASALSVLITVQAQRLGGGLKSADFAPFSTRLLVAAHSLASYLAAMIFPLNLSPFHPYPDRATLHSAGYLAAAALPAIVTAVLLVRRNVMAPALAAWLCYIVTVLPVLGLMQVGIQSMADRYTYLPSGGPFLCFAYGIVRGMRPLGTSQARRLRPGMLAGALAAVLALPMSLLTIRQIGVWKDGITLWSSVIEKQPTRVPLAYYNRGLAYATAGRLDAAAADYDLAISLDPLYAKAHNNRGMLYYKAGDFKKALEHYDRAIEIDGTDPTALANRGLAYGRLGLYAAAMSDLNKALARDPRNAKAALSRGNVFLLTGEKPLALADFQTACKGGEEKGCAAWRDLGPRH